MGQPKDVEVDGHSLLISQHPFDFSSHKKWLLHEQNIIR